MAGLVAATAGLVLLLLPFAPWFHLTLAGHPALFPSLATGLAVLTALLLISLILERRKREAVWRGRAAVRTGLPAIAAGRDAGRRRKPKQDAFEWLLAPLLHLPSARRLSRDWSDAGYGDKASRYLLLISLAAAIGGGIGLRIAGPLLAAAMAGGVAFILVRSVRARAGNARRRLEQQLPEALDAMAAGLAAGLSFPQAVSFSAGELPFPASQVMTWLNLRLQLGFPIERTLSDVLDVFPEPSLAFALDGINLQRSFGGDLVAMLHQTSALLRERADIEREVQAVTSQGKLSGWIVAALVPVSAAVLLFSNPRYIDVLFGTLVGQALLVLTIILQILGWLAISRLVRLRY